MSRSVLLRPRWVLGHLVVLVMIGVMLSLANWQHNRLDERRAENRRIEAVINAAPEAVTSAARLNSLQEDARVTLTGTYETRREVYVRYKLLEGRPGMWSLVPFRLPDGSVVIVNKGWKADPQAKTDSRSQQDQPKELSITGFVKPGQDATGTVDQTSGNPSIPTVRSVNSNQLEEVMSLEQLPANFVQLTEPPASDDLQVLPGPQITEGSHFAYMLQWIAFSLVVLIGWMVLLRKVTSDEARDPNSNGAIDLRGGGD